MHETGDFKCRRPSTLVGKGVGGADTFASKRFVVVRSSSVFNHLARVLLWRGVGGHIAIFSSAEKAMRLTWRGAHREQSSEVGNRFFGNTRD
jgi:hypothetical protein